MIADKERPRVLIATGDGVYQYTIENTYDLNNSLNVNLTLLSGSQVNTEKQLVVLSNNDVADLLASANLTSPAPNQT
ncbi:MAG: hypothetical protein OSA92_07410, partial [Pirellulaceae bacterium]|nr:hypothetical protein [Pirellulaceae bacterium]